MQNVLQSWFSLKRYCNACCQHIIAFVRTVSAFLCFFLPACRRGPMLGDILCEALLAAAGAAHHDRNQCGGDLPASLLTGGGPVLCDSARQCGGWRAGETLNFNP